MNPFQMHDVSDFPDVYVPLAQSTRHPSITADYKEKYGTVSESPEKLGDEPQRPNSRPSATTIEGLRQEIDLDIAASGHDTSYDRKSKVINKVNPLDYLQRHNSTGRG